MTVGAMPFTDFSQRARNGQLVIGCGPVATRVRARARTLLRDIYDVYADYPVLDLHKQGADFTVNVQPISVLRRFFRPSYQALADKPGPFAPLPGDISFVGYEMSQNWQIACTQNQNLLFHAATVSDDQGNGIMMPGLSGSGKSTLGAAMGFAGWRFLGDEFALFSPQDKHFHALPRPISLKNASIDVMKGWAPNGGFSRVFENTPKGTMAYLRPPADALAASQFDVRLSMVVFPKYQDGSAGTARKLRGAEAAIELTNACVNFDRIGQAAFEQIATWANTVPVFQIEYPSLEVAIDLVVKLHAQAKAAT